MSSPPSAQNVVPPAAVDSIKSDADMQSTPGHGEGATCSCLEDIMNGVHPCGECIGEILEGHGNRLIAKYFATAISEEVGAEHLDTIKQIIASKYNISVEEQI